MTGTTADTQWKFSATYVVLPNENVDTDQIIPARFLTTTDRIGLGPNAFNDWRYLADGSPNPDLPRTTARVTIEEIGSGRTRMSIESLFPSTEAMEQVLALGAEEGLKQAVGQIDAILAEDGVRSAP